MPSRLVFSEKTHTYALDGKRVPGVTSVIGRATEKPQLVWAAAKETAKWAADNPAPEGEPDRWIRTATGIHRELWSAKGERGRLIHDIALRLVRGDPVDPVDGDGNPWPEDITASANQAARFMDEWDVAPLVTERPVYHENHLWAGTVDLVAVLKDGRRWLLDYKTGETGIYPKDAMQLAAYRHATHCQVATDDGLEDWPMPEVEAVGCIWLRPDFYELRPVRADEYAYQVFWHMLTVAAWTTETKEQNVFEPLPVPA